jgi:hypothetical protein
VGGWVGRGWAGRMGACTHANVCTCMKCFAMRFLEAVEWRDNHPWRKPKACSGKPKHRQGVTSSPTGQQTRRLLQNQHSHSDGSSLKAMAKYAHATALASLSPLTLFFTCSWLKLVEDTAPLETQSSSSNTLLCHTIPGLSLQPHRTKSVRCAAKLEQSQAMASTIQLRCESTLQHQQHTSRERDQTRLPTVSMVAINADLLYAHMPV